MLFEIFNKEGARTFYTTNKSCLPPKEQVQSRIKNGEVFKVDGKIVKTYEKILEAAKL